MSDTKQIQALKNAAKEKREATMGRVLAALQVMQDQNIPINFESVANFAQVSKTWVYAQPSIKEEINKIKNKADSQRYMKNHIDKIKVLETEIYILGKQNKQLRGQIDELKKQLEVAYAALYNKNE